MMWNNGEDIVNVENIGEQSLPSMRQICFGSMIIRTTSYPLAEPSPDHVMKQFTLCLPALSALLLNAGCFRENTVTTRTQEMSIRSDYEAYLQDGEDFFEFTSQKEFTSRLSGNNPRGIRYMVLNTYPLDREGLIIDEWGRPLQISRPDINRLEIRSAGRDGKLDTQDDIVTVHPRVKDH